MTHNTI